MKKKLSILVLSIEYHSNRENDQLSAAFMQQGLIGRQAIQPSITPGNDQMSDSETTTDHNAIKKWAEERDGHPATVRATEEDGRAGVLRIDFGPREERLEGIGWDEFFRKFDDSRLAFLYQDRTKDGKLSRFHKFVRRSAA